MASILIAVHGFPPTHGAGAERRAERMAQWLSTHGHHVTVFALENVEATAFHVETSQQDNFTIHRVFYNVKDGNAFHNLYDSPKVGEAFNQVLASEHFDLVHVVSGYLMGGQVILGARRAGLPVVITLTEYWFLCARINMITATGHLCSGPETDEKCARCLIEDKRRYRVPATYAPQLTDKVWQVAKHLPFATKMTKAVGERHVTLREALEAANLVICPSQYLISTFNQYGFDTHQFVYMRQGIANPIIDVTSYHKDSGDTLKLVYAGQIKYHKGVELLIEAVASLLKEGHKLTLDIWGSETEEPEYTNMLKKRTLEYPAIKWNGRYSGADNWKVLSKYDVLVIPSRWYENSPNVILESYEMKMPVIATKLGGMAELVEHEKSGLLFELNNSNDLRNQIKRLLTEPALLPKLRNNLPNVKHIQEEMEEIVGYYDHIIAQDGYIVPVPIPAARKHQSA